MGIGQWAAQIGIMAQNTQLPWASGPAEILRHGLGLLNSDSQVNRRLAMILIDNAVELMIGTYLGLPRRVTGLSVPRREYADFSQSFPGLLDALERYAPDKLVGIDLGTIEWYHRLRNQLYHPGNGLSIERDKVEIYAELANILFKNIFGIRLVPHATTKGTYLLGQFIELWAGLERGLAALAAREIQPTIELNLSDLSEQPRTALQAAQLLKSTKLFSEFDVNEINRYCHIRNQVLHGGEDHRKLITSEVVERLKAFVHRIPETARATAKPMTEKQ